METRNKIISFHGGRHGLKEKVVDNCVHMPLLPKKSNFKRDLIEVVNFVIYIEHLQKYNVCSNEVDILLRKQVHHGKWKQILTLCRD